MADSNCGCGPSGSNPPGTTQPTVSSPVGSISSFGGNAMAARGPCRPTQCPSPPTSDAEERVPYCAGWANQLTTKVAGMLMMVLEGCLYKLWSKCSGFVYYDKDTEQISVQDPKFVSAIPKEAPYGFLAKVVPTVHTVCVDGQDACQQEIRQELAAQVMDMASCGALVIARAPLCGDVPVEQSGDLSKQVRFDYLDPPDHEDVGCPDLVRFLVSYPGKRGPSNSQVDCQQFSGMYRLKLRGSQWGFIPEGSPLESSAKQVVLIQVPGGTDDDPCFELRVLESGQGGLPATADNCDGLQFLDKGLPTEGWKAYKKGLAFHPVTRAQVFTSSTMGAGAFTFTLPEYPSDACGPIWVELELDLNAALGPSGSPTSFFIKDTATNHNLAQAGTGPDVIMNQSKCPTTSSLLSLTSVKSGTGVCGLTIFIVGYHY